MTCPLTLVDYVLLSVTHLEVGTGWYYAVVGSSKGVGENQQLLAKSSFRVLFEVWCHENAKGAWAMDDNGILFKDEQDAILFKMSSPHS